MELAGVSPRAPRVTELNTKIDRAALVPAMVRIRGGSFLVSNHRAVRDDDYSRRRSKVGIGGFRMGKYEVTFEEFDRFATETSRPKPHDSGWGRGRRPAINVTWREATEYAKWLSAKLGDSYRLPTSAEWEYAARAGRTSKYPWGDTVGSDRANCTGCGSRWDKRSTAPVGSFRPNAWGLHDVAGNVCEWTCSSHATGRESKTCGSDVDLGGKTGKDEGADAFSKLLTAVQDKLINVRVCRGGFWNYGPRKLIVVFQTFEKDHSANTLGFRLAQD